MTSNTRGVGRVLFAMCCALACALIFGVHRVPAAPTEATAYELALVDFSGRKQLIGTLPGSVFAPRISPDGKKVAFEMRGAPNAKNATPLQLYVADLAHLDKRRALPMVGTGRNWAPIWSPDGARLVFLVTGEAPDALWWRRADGTGDAERLVDGRSAEAMTADGHLAFITLTGDRDYGISLLDVASKASTPLVDRQGTEQHSSRVSADGRWIAYASNETGRHEIWVEPMPPTGKRYQVTHTGGSHPVWSPDGRQLYFDRDGRLFDVEVFPAAPVVKAMPVNTAAQEPQVVEPVAGEARELPIVGFQQGYRRRQFDLMPDGKQFLMLFPRGGRT